MAKSDAERKARQRAGYKSIWVEVHLDTFASTLLAEELITEGQMEDLAAIQEAAGQYIGRHCKMRVLRDMKANVELLPERRHPKAKRRDQPQHGPVTVWSNDDIEAWESGKLRTQRLSSYGNRRPGYSGHIAGQPWSGGHLDEFPPIKK